MSIHELFNPDEVRIVATEIAHNSLFTRAAQLVLTPKGWWMNYSDSTCTEAVFEGFIPTRNALAWLKDLAKGRTTIFGCEDRDLRRNFDGSWSCSTYVY